MCTHLQAHTVHTPASTHMHTHISHTCMHTHMYTHLSAYTCTSIHTPVSTHTCAHACKHTYDIHLQKHTCTHIYHTPACTYKCTHTCKHIHITHMQTHTCTHMSEEMAQQLRAHTALIGEHFSSLPAAWNSSSGTCNIFGLCEHLNLCIIYPHTDTHTHNFINKINLGKKNFSLKTACLWSPEPM